MQHLLRRRTSFLIALAGCLLAVLVSATTPANAAEPWPTTRFKVFPGNPAIYELLGLEWVEFEDLIGGPDDDSIDEIERAFEEAARWYQRHGFPPPALGPIVDTEDGPAYQVYACSVEADKTVWDAVWGVIGAQDNSLVVAAMPWAQCTSAGLYLPQCGDDPSRTRITYVNPEKSLDGKGHLTELGYQTIAHELMHAVVANTPMGRSNSDCTAGRWITEGLADAISFDLAEDEWKGRYQPGTSSEAVIKRHGYRPYLERLPQQHDLPVPTGNAMLDAGYGTSSFWRYLADATPEGWRYLLTRRPGAAPGVLDIPLPAGKGWRREVKWLDQGLRGKFNLGLDQLYGLFVNHFAYRVAPMKSYQKKPAEDNLEHWVELLFGKCEEVNVSASTPIQTVSLEIKALASACIWVNPTGAPGLVQISFQAGSDDLSLLRDLSIGKTGTTLLVRGTPIAHTPHGPTRYVASWRDYPQDGSQRTLYVVSNVADKPVDTVPRTVELTVVFPHNANTARSTVPLPPARVAEPPQQPSYDKHAPSLARQRQATAKMVAEQMHLDKQSLNANVTRGTSAVRRPKQPPCEEPFKYTACGPHLLIGLSVEPGTYIGPGQTNAQGGIAAQAFGALQAMSQTSLADTQPVMQEIEARLDQIDGSRVSITMPLIDYGFSGEFDNASISVDMSGDRTWRTFGPPDAQGRTRLTGKVAIEEYTPFFIRGSFVAPLAEFVLDAQGEPVYTRRDTVSGTFTSVAPWQRDERTEILQLDTHDQLADDIANTLGVPPDMVYSLKQQGVIPGGSGATPDAAASGGGGGGGGASVVEQECTCECDTRPFVDELCALMCEEEFAACDDL